MMIISLVGLLSWTLYQIQSIRVFWAAHDPRNATRASIAMVLGDRLDGGEVGAHFRQRLDRAIDLYERNVVDRLLVSGGGQPPEALIGKSYLVARGVPPKHILTETESCSTAENIQYSKEILDGQGMAKSVILVTNGFHLKRALSIAHRIGIPAQGAAAEPRPLSVGAVWSSLVREALAITVQPFWPFPVQCRSG